jgi:quercetin dioxygenase-like cupin family protein
MEIKRIGSQPSVKGPADWFTGTVRIDPLFQPNESRRAAAATVTFEPGARTAWHTHPLGQTLIVTAGCGRAQRESGPIEEIRPGDVVRNNSRARSSTGWKKSATHNTPPDRASF